MAITLYNTKTKVKQALAPLKPGAPTMYVCGPTVYDRAHIGNARSAVVFDLLFRVLRHDYGADAVTYVRNITDIDDKIMARAVETGRAIDDITAETAQWYADDMAYLGCLPPTHQPRATEHVDDMIAMIVRLIEKGAAYAAEGHALFAVKADAEYGALARRSVDEMRAGARIDPAPYKRDPMDFVLWKPSAEDQPGWESPWGRGRPGWHIECSAMSEKLLGPEFDIHGGGVDLVFPHHENEWAQSRCANPDHGFAQVWMHNGFLMVEGEKMSKSLGNFTTVEDLRQRGVPGEVMRLAMLMTHYRQPLDWTGKVISEAEKTLRKWRAATAEATASAPPAEVSDALADDLNTPRAIAGLHAEREPAALLAGARAMGLLTDDLGGWDAAPDVGDEGALIERLLAARADAKQARDFARADAIRDGLAAAGVIVKDTKDGATWSLSSEFDAAKLSSVVAT